MYTYSNTKMIIERNSFCTATHTGVDHVWSLCSCCLDCLEDVHSSFNFDSLNFRHTSNEHTTARHTVTGEMDMKEIHECELERQFSKVVENY